MGAWVGSDGSAGSQVQEVHSRKCESRSKHAGKLVKLMEMRIIQRKRKIFGVIYDHNYTFETMRDEVQQKSLNIKCFKCKSASTTFANVVDRLSGTHRYYEA